MTLDSRRLAVRLGLGLSLSSLFWWAANVWSLLPYGSGVFYRVEHLAAFGCLLALVGVPAALVAALSPRARPPAIRLGALVRASPRECIWAARSASDPASP